MSDESKIEWCDSTFNPWIGCTKVGLGCDHCYAEADFDLRKHRVKWGAGNPRSRTSAANWKKPLLWDRQHAEFFAQHGRRRRVFCASLSDVFDNEVPAEWRAELFALIADTPNLDWLLLTKRIGNARSMIERAMDDLNELDPERLWIWGSRPWPNVWLGATICNQPEHNRDAQKLLSVPAAVRFLSIEPMLGAIDAWTLASSSLHEIDGGPKIDWVIAGGESGPHARPMHPAWTRSLRDQCASAGVPFLFKQHGEWAPRSSCYHTFEDGKSLADIDPGATQWPCIRITEAGNNGRDLEHSEEGDHVYMQRVGKKLAGRLLDGVQHDGYPEARP